MFLRDGSVVQNMKITPTLKNESLIMLNPSRPDPGQAEKINLNFCFQTSLWCLKKFYEGLKAFIKTFKAPQRSVKIKI